MKIEEFIDLLKNRKQVVFAISILFLTLTLAITFLQPLKHRATSRILLVQEAGLNSDAYSISRSNQFLTATLAEVIYSGSFLEQALSAGFNIETSYFSLDLNKRAKQWHKTVSSRALSDTGMIIINTYHPDKYQAEQINKAVVYTLISKHQQYHGLKDKISLIVLDKTTTSNWPVKPNIILNFLFGLAGGLILALAFIYVFPRAEINFWPRQKSREFSSGRVEKEYYIPKERSENSRPNFGEMGGKNNQEEYRPPEANFESGFSNEQEESSRNNDNNYEDISRGNIENVL